jgi:AraC-like DNA-binding protein
MKNADLQQRKHNMARKLEKVEKWEKMAEPAHYHVAELAHAQRESPRSLEREFRKYVHLSPRAWLQRRLFEAARRRLTEGWSVKEAFAISGFRRAGDFSRAFKRYFGLCPRDVLRAASDEDENSDAPG